MTPREQELFDYRLAFQEAESRAERLEADVKRVKALAVEWRSHAADGRSQLSSDYRAAMCALADELEARVSHPSREAVFTPRPRAGWNTLGKMHVDVWNALIDDLGMTYAKADAVLSAIAHALPDKR